MHIPHVEEKGLYESVRLSFFIFFFCKEARDGEFEVEVEIVGKRGRGRR